LDQIVLAGLNGTGKTTILEVLKALFDGAFDPSPFRRNKNFPKLIREKLYAELKHSGKEIIWPTNLHKDKLIKIVNDEKVNIIYRPAKIRNDIIRNENYIGQFKDDNYLEYGGVIEVSYENESTIKKHYLGETEIKPITNPQFIHFHKGKMKEIIIKPLLGKVLMQENKSTKEAKDYEVEEINSVFSSMDMNSKFIDFDPDNLFFKSANNQKIIFEELSSGEKQLYFMGFMLKRLNINNTIIMIDEPEDSLHPKWQSQLLQFYSNIGENNQVILATHSPHIIGSAKAESVFLLKNVNGKITASHPKYTKGHTINYVLSEIMDVDYRNTYNNNLVNKYLTLIRKGEHENEAGKKLWKEIVLLDPGSPERQRIDLALRRFKVIGK